VANLEVHGARSRTLLQLRDEVRQRSDTENDPHIVDDEITRWINQSAARWYGKLVRARGEGYFLKRVPAVTALGQNTVAVPADFFKLKGIQWDRGGGNLTRINRLELQEFLRQSTDTQTWGEGDIGVMVEGLKFRFHPTPNALYNLLIWYLPTAPELVDDDDTFDGVNGWEDWVVLDAAIKAMTKQRRDASGLRMERAAIEADLETLAGEIDEGQPGKVVDVEYVAARELFPEYWRP
jgi:hypothetical protein